MLSEQSVPVVRATLPAVGAAIGDIADVFYRKLFDAHPELLRDLFNRGNQANGEQQRALAGSIAAFAGMLLENPDQRADVMLSRISHKHASLGITPDQYKIVHENIMAAIVDVLGDAVTPEVARAWDEVYWLMANALIALEARLYAQTGVEAGDVWRSMEIVDRIEESADAVSLVLRPADDSAPATFRPGQYVSVQVELPDGARQIRQYSLSAAPGRPDLRITVKRVRGDGRPDGEVSSWLHANARKGDVLTTSAPFGDLALAEHDGPLLLASAGIGVTPVLAMLDHLAAGGSTRPVTVVHADRTPDDHAHRQEQLDLIRALPDARLHLWYEEPGDGAPEASTGRADLTGLDLPEGLTAYLCGPVPFMRAVRGDLLSRGVPAEAVHYEVFGPDLWLGQQ
ncbi:hemin transporter [Streptomyces sp. KPB2]|uniref:globin domain-containing protein n=1 Tax=Streptomyces TaxID=1883 RepID=UPI000F6C649C|nr:MULTISPECIES: globin domain-containing protein [unclassified Streptomyces]WSU05473.1 FAD-binding oxidoreductase [Streptomyces sp. NBC_01124]AZM79455.1 hemin transporter [Streptomyces sp. KPB2]MBH5132994.1 hemin transporter [Streptomyces sp. HB-N217]MDU0252158.1 globin domain-containing protein [Streptomyces sp. PU10]QKW65079.1 hemin transporter [Streptomyces sp. NA03103]